MKTIKSLLLSCMMITALTINATEPNSAATAEVKQCGVTNAQITTYVQGLGHTVLWIRDISGTCNSTVGIENCSTVTVFVSEGIIMGHADNIVSCPN